MKKIFFALMGILFLASSCSKEESEEQKAADSNFFVRFKAGAETKEYKDIVLALRTTNGGMNTVAIQGQETLNANTPGIIVTITDPAEITAKTYTENGTNDSPATLYRDAAAKEFSNLFMTTASGFSVTITEINTTTVRGTFNGKVSDLNGDELTISDGSFYAKFQ